MNEEELDPFDAWEQGLPTYDDYAEADNAHEKAKRRLERALWVHVAAIAQAAHHMASTVTFDDGVTVQTDLGEDVPLTWDISSALVLYGEQLRELRPEKWRRRPVTFSLLDPDAN